MVERFLQAQMINGMKATAQGRSDTFYLSRAQGSQPRYLHDGRRLFALEYTVEFLQPAPA